MRQLMLLFSVSVSHFRLILLHFLEYENFQEYENEIASLLAYFLGSDSCQHCYSLLFLLFLFFMSSVCSLKGCLWLSRVAMS